MAVDQPPSRHRDDYRFWTDVTIRYSDQDPMKHVNNVAVTAYLESGRAALIRETVHGFGVSPMGMVLANVSVDFLHEMKYPGTVQVGGRFVRVGSRSFTTQYAIFQNDRCCVTSQSTNVFFDSEIRKSAEPPAGLMGKLRQYMSG